MKSRLWFGPGMLVLFCACPLLYRVPLRGQDHPPQEPTVIRVSSNLISVPVSVTDVLGRPVRDLEAVDFVLEEDGQRQVISKMGEPGHVPVELALLFDVSGSVRPRFEFEREAASRFVMEVLGTSDKISVFSIGPTPKLLAERTADTGGAVSGILRIEPTRDATAFYDAVVEAARYLRSTSPIDALRVQVVVSDGEDNFSDRNSLWDAMRELQRADCLFYAINPSGPSIRFNKVSLRGQEGMQTLAQQTGGAAFLPDRAEDLNGIFERIANELKTQYLLGYYSSEDRSDGAFRRIVVRIPARPELRVRARQGYFPPKTS